jgi:hypothetical protein
MLRMTLRSWVAFAEESLVDGALVSDLSPEELVAFLERTLFAVVPVIDPAYGALLRPDVATSS